MDQDIRIAFITPEAPPFSGGGIATFINNITKGLNEAGIFCEVFAPAVNAETSISTLNGVTFHHISTSSLEAFRTDVIPYFRQRHLKKEFTIVESCEIHAPLLGLMHEKESGLKYVIRVQMPAVLQSHLNNYYESRLRKLRYVLGGFRRGRWDLGFWNRVDVKRKNNPEYQVCKMADQIIAPSWSFKEWLQNFWKLNYPSITVIPHLFDFNSFVENKPATQKEESESITILFVGKLNAQKGVINLAKVADTILKKFPNVKFILIGEDWPTRYKMQEKPTGELLKEISSGNERFQLTGKINYDELYDWYQQADICIFPSLWEAWGYTCTEAMSMGKAVIGSKYGGMADAIKDGKNGLLCDPYDINDIENKLVRLIEDRNLRIQLGSEAHKTIETTLNFKKLVADNIQCYREILAG